MNRHQRHVVILLCAVLVTHQRIEQAVTYILCGKPDQAIATFSTTGQGQQGQSTAIRIQDDMYIVNLHLRDYDFQSGKTYIVGVMIFGQPR